MDHRPEHAPAGYDDDVYAWSRRQAEILRGLGSRRRDLPNDLDLEHVAEEIEDLGKSELKRVLSHLRQMLVHAVELSSSPQSDARAGWTGEILDHQALAGDHFTNAMRKDIDLDALWQRACREASKKLAVHGEAMAPMPDTCPMTLDELLDEALEVEDLVGRLARR